MKLSMNAEFYDMRTAEMMMSLERNGIRVPVFTNNVLDMGEWCELNCKGLYRNSYDGVLIDDDVYERSRKIAHGEIPNPRLNADSSWFEAAISDNLAREMNRDIDREIAEQLGYKIPYIYYWFEDRDEAMLFKLTFGGA